MIDFEFLSVIRAQELKDFERELPPGGRILEIGGGTGQQARMLVQRGFDVVSVEVQGSVYCDHRVFPVLEYDGQRLPFADDTFDAAFSSNVLEHVVDLNALLSEQTRVLRPGGVGIHTMPTFSWRIWTSASHYLDVMQRAVKALPALLPRGVSLRRLVRDPLNGARQIASILFRGLFQARHGERGNLFTEIGYFHPAWWRRKFKARGYQIVADRPMKLFYTGYMIFGKRLGLETRKRLSQWLGSACHLYRIAPEGKVEDGHG